MTKCYSTRSNARRAAASAGLDVSTLTFIKTKEGWTWQEPSPEAAGIELPDPAEPVEAAAPAKAPKAPGTSRTGRTARLIELASRPEGASVEEMRADTGLKDVSTQLRDACKRLGLTCEVRKIEGVSRYFVVN